MEKNAVQQSVERKGKQKFRTVLSDWLPARFILTFLIFWGMCLIFAQRVCLNVAIVAMVNQSAEAALPSSNDSQDDLSANQCPLPTEERNATYKYQEGTYSWTPSVQGLILGSYFYGYVLTQLVGGRLADLVGAKWLFGSATLFSTLLTLFTPYLAHCGATYMIALRIVLGLTHGMNYPSAYTLFTYWAPVQERSTLLSICVIGTHFGIVLSMPLTGYLCEYGFAGGWPSAFYILGLIGCVWFVFWGFLVFNTPKEHPRITDEERTYIQKNLPAVSEEVKNRPTPWTKVATSLPIWAVTIAKFTGAWSFICFQTKLPAYLEEVLHFPIQKNGMVNAMLFAALCVSVVTSGSVSDFIRARQYLRITTIRKTFETIALVGPALCMLAIPHVGCNSTAVVALLTSAMALFGLCGGGDVSVIVDLAPDFAGKIFGISNAIASVPGILSPIIAGIFLEGNRGDVRQWTYIFYISVALYLFGTIVFLLFGSAETQPWGIVQDHCASTTETVEKGRNQKQLTRKAANLQFIVPVITMYENEVRETRIKGEKIRSDFDEKTRF